MQKYIIRLSNIRNSQHEIIVSIEVPEEIGIYHIRSVLAEEYAFLEGEKRSDLYTLLNHTCSKYRWCWEEIITHMEILLS